MCPFLEKLLGSIDYATSKSDFNPADFRGEKGHSLC